MASFQTPAANHRQLSLHSSVRSRSSRGINAAQPGAGPVSGGFLARVDQTESIRSTILNTPAVQTPSAAATGSDELDEWIVFSPSTTAGDTTTASYSYSNALSRASELASVDARRHDDLPGAFFDSQVEPGQNEDEEDEEDEESSFDGAETDSLQPFHEQDHEGPVMLPTHDGLGTFPVSSGVITGFQSLEESLRIIAAAGNNHADSDLNARIQKWRLEQSKALLDEIERITRRRRSVASGIGGHAITRQNSVSKEEEDMASLNVPEKKTVSPESATPTQPSAGEKLEEESEETQESLWRRITRSFIRDIIGIDDALLQVIFGEALPADVILPPQPEPTPAFPFQEDGIAKEAGDRLANRIAKELGLFVNSYGAQSTGEQAFASYARRKLDEEEEDDGAKTPQPGPRQKQLFEEQSYSAASSRKRQRSASFHSMAPSETVSTMPQFQFVPTLSNHHHHHDEASHAALWGIEEREEETERKMEAQIRKEYWEQELDVRVFFSFLKDRFSSSASARSSKKSSTSVITAASSAAAAPPYTHHPLINKNYQRNTFKTPGASSSSAPATRKPSSATGSSSKLVASSNTSTGGQFATFGVRQGSSCASRSANGKAAGSSKASSRGRGYYWDVASSVGSGKTGSCVGTGVWAAI
ncbi:hypothetical protein RUND412_001757 [Rhizina undulata]